MHRIEEVVGRDMCIGCGGCTVQTRGAIPVRLTEAGSFEADLSRATQAEIRQASTVCPFSDEAPNEDQITSELYSTGDFERTQGVGAHLAIGILRRMSDESVMRSSSGGGTSWILAAMLRHNLIDEVIHVGRTSLEATGLFEYRTSHNALEIDNNRKSQYYATTLADALREVRDNGPKRYALVGVPCFIRAARNLARYDPVLRGRLIFHVGLVCGHMKNRYFAEALAWQVGVEPGELGAVDFRVKVPGRPSSDYDFEATSVEGPIRSGRTKNLVGGNWGHAAFQPEACNFCDDVYAETADIVFGDAWLKRFSEDWRGHNIVVCRNAQLLELIRSGFDSGELFWEEVGSDQALEAQSGAFRHRVDGMRVRLHDDQSAGLSVPTKRHSPAISHLDPRRVALVRQRRHMSKMSTESFLEAKRSGDLGVFSRAMRRDMRKYSRLEASLLRRMVRKLRGVVRSLLTWRH